MRDDSFRRAVAKASGKLGEPTKTTEQNFADWEAHAFGFGYGTGEPHILRAMKAFFDAFGVDGQQNSYDYERLEEAVTAPVAWLLINRMCQIDLIEYGTSPRFAWLTEEGVALREFLSTKTVTELDAIISGHDEHCYPDSCNCGPNGYEEGRVCYNPFWPHHH